MRYLLIGLCLILTSTATAQDKIPRVAIITTVWYQNSHADVIGGRVLEGYNLNGEGAFPKLKAVSIFTDQVPTIAYDPFLRVTRRNILHTKDPGNLTGKKLHFRNRHKTPRSAIDNGQHLYSPALSF